MKFNPLARPNPAPLDRFWITTDLRINPDAIENPARFRSLTGMPLRKVKPTVSFSRNERYRSCQLHIADYYGLVVHVDMRRDKPWTLRKIEANVGNLLYGANGRVIDEHELQLGLSLLIELLTPLLADPRDHIHLVPGLAENPVSYWKMLEIPFQIFDSDGHFQRLFHNPRHPEIKKAALRCDKESVKLGHKNAQMKIDFYMKNIEMKKVLRKFGRTAQSKILRVEIILKDQKLAQHLGNHGVLTTIHGKSRLVSFTGPALISAHREVMGKLEGCYQINSGDPGPNTDKTGRLMAQISHRTGFPVDDMISIYEGRFGVSSITRERFKKAALDEAARLSSWSPADIFSSSNYRNQPLIDVPNLEKFPLDRRAYTEIHPRVAEVYKRSDNLPVGALYWAAR